MLTLYKPGIEDLWFKQHLLSDAATMSYNHAYGGTIPFPTDCWEAWHRRWLQVSEAMRYYRYVQKNDQFIGEVAYRYDEEREIYVTDVIIHAAFRKKGYGKQALLMLCEEAKKNGIRTLYDDIAIDNPAVALFECCGFTEDHRTDEYVMMKKQLIAE